MIIDLRSDTVTKPTKQMREFMMNAEVGDDVFGEDTTINLLEQKTAKLLGAESAMFCPTATMCNQIALKVLTQPMDEIIVDKLSHIYNYEAGGYAFHSGCGIRTVEGDRGRLSPQQIEENINPADVHKTITSLVCLENTCNKGGGSIYSLDQIKEIKNTCDKNNLKLHLDGSRLFNALVATNEDATEYGRLFDTITICLSKGLGCPVGALLVSNKVTIQKSRRIRKVFGGGMRQAGILAAAGVYALKHNIERLQIDNSNAKKLGEVLSESNYVESILPVETNIVIFKLKQNMRDDDFINYLSSKNILAFSIGDNSVRFVTHLDVDAQMIEETLNVLKEFKKNN